MGRAAKLERNTKETKIKLSLDLDGTGNADIQTGVGFFDHMLTHIAFHGRFDLSVRAQGDLEVDSHHTVEDVGICLGAALKQALGDKAGITRFGSAFVPMDESLAQVVLDLSNRPLMSFKAEKIPGTVGAFDGQLAEEFWRALANSAGITLHVILHYGTNDHHLLEAAFKALGRALKQAVAIDPTAPGVVSTKGVL